MRFFVSYNHVDREWAEWVAWQVEAAGHAAVIQAWDFTPGNNFVLRMDEAVRYSDRTILILSPEFLESPFAAAEWAAVFAQDPKGARDRILPIRVRPCEPSGLLGQLVYLDLVRLDEESAAARLRDALQGMRLKPTTAPLFPRSDEALGTRSASADEDRGYYWYVNGEGPRRVDLLDLLGFAGATSSPRAVLERWRASTDLPLACLLGIDMNNVRVALDITKDGPCGYIHGYSGMGTTEVLRVMALSIATTYPPSRARFHVVARSRGGGGWRGLLHLPHTGVIMHAGQTAEGIEADLSPVLGHKAQLLRAAGCRDLGEYNERARAGGEAELPFDMVFVDESYGGPILAALARLHRQRCDLGFGVIVAVQSMHYLTDEFLTLCRFVINIGRPDLFGLPTRLDPGWRQRLEKDRYIQSMPGRGLLIRAGASPLPFQAAMLDDWSYPRRDAPYLTSATLDNVVQAVISANRGAATPPP